MASAAPPRTRLAREDRMEQTLDGRPLALRRARLRVGDDGRGRRQGRGHQAAPLQLLRQQGAPLHRLHGTRGRRALGDGRRGRGADRDPRPGAAGRRARPSSPSSTPIAPPGGCSSTRRCRGAARSPSGSPSTAAGSSRSSPSRCSSRSPLGAGARRRSRSRRSRRRSSARPRPWRAGGCAPRRSPPQEAAELLISTARAGPAPAHGAARPVQRPKRKAIAGDRQAEPRRRHRRQPHPLRALQQRLLARFQPGHAHRRPRRPRRPLRPRGRAARRGRRRRGAQALPRPRPDPRERARHPPRAGDARLRRPAGLRHRPGDDDPRRQQDRARPDRRRHRLRRRHHLRRSDRAQRGPARDAAGGQPAALDRRQAARPRRAPSRPHRAGDPAQRGAAHRPLDGRALRAHGRRLGGRPRRAGRARRRQPPQPGRRLRARLPRRPAHPLPRPRARPEPAPRLRPREAGEAEAGLRRSRRDDDRRQLDPAQRRRLARSCWPARSGRRSAICRCSPT